MFRGGILSFNSKVQTWTKKKSKKAEVTILLLIDPPTYSEAVKHTHQVGSHLYLIPQGEDWRPAARIPWTNKFADLKNKGKQIRNRWSD